jgi:hypothetical protein
LHSGPRPELVVTRHPNLLKVLRERGVIDDSTPVIDRAVRADDKDRHVLGILPNHLASAAASITEIPMRLSPEDRRSMAREELPLERMRVVASDPVTYLVRRLEADRG